MSDDYIEVGGRITPVYNRFKEVGDYHPFTAETFADWSLQAGDIVTLKKNGESFEAPVYATRMTWRGATPHMELTTTGNLNRDSLTKLGERKYSSGAGGGGGGYRNSDLINTRLEQNERMIALAAWDATDADRQYSSQFTVHANKISAVTALADANGSILKQAGFELTPDGFLVYAEDATKPNYLSSKFKVQADQITTLVEKTGINSLGQGVTLYSRISQTAESITAEVNRATEAEGSLSTRILQTAESITAEVNRATEAEGSLSSRITATAESITAEVNRATEAEGSLSSRIAVTAESIVAEVNRATEAEGSLSARILQTAESLTAEVNRATEAEGSLSSRITATAESITAEVNRAMEAEGSLSSRISVTAESITAEVARANAAEGSLSSRITQTAESITAEVNRASEAEGSLSSRITMTAESITAEVARATSAEGSLSSRITVTAESITAEVTRANAAEGSLSSRIAQTAESITAEVNRATNAEGSLSSRITMTAESITTEVTRATNAEGSLSSRITQTAESITAEVSRASEAEGSLSSRIAVTANSITSVVSKTGINSLDQGETLYSRIEQNAESITTKVSAGDIASTINQTAQSVTINASKIDLSGYVTATEFGATKAKIDNLTGATIVENFCRAGLVVGTTVTANNTFTHAGDTIYKRPLRWVTNGTIIATVHAVGTDASSIILSHSHAMTVSSTGVVTVGAPQAANGTFNIADTAFFKAEMASATSNVKISAWKWDAANNTAYVEKGETGFDTQGLPLIEILGYGDWWASTHAKTYRAYANIDGTNRTVAEAVVDATSVYHSGWDNARGMVVAPGTTNISSTMSVGIPASTYDQSSSLAFTVSVDSDYAYIQNALGNAVARVANTPAQTAWSSGNAYGWNQAAATVAVPHKDSWPGGSADAQATFTYPVSGGSTATKTYTLSASVWGGDGIGDSKKCYAYMMETSDGAAARLVVDASSVYSAGNTAGQTTGWNNAAAISVLPTRAADNAHFTATIPTSGGGTSQKSYYLNRTAGSWSNGSKTIYVYELNDSEQAVATIAYGSVSMPSTATWNIRSETGRTYGITVKVTCTVGGKDYDGQATI